MKPRTIIVAAFAGVTAAGYVQSAQQGHKNLTVEEVCEWYETGRGNSERKVNQKCRVPAAKCIQDHLGKGEVPGDFETLKTEVDLCTFSPMFGKSPTEFPTIIETQLDIDPEKNRRLTSWCVMDHATWTGGRLDNPEDTDWIIACVARKNLNQDGDTVKNLVATNGTEFNCKAAHTGKLIYELCSDEADPNLEIVYEMVEQYKQKEQDIENCKERLQKSPPKIRSIKDLDQVCEEYGVECFGCKLSDKDASWGGSEPHSDLRYINCQTRPQTAASTLRPSANEMSGDQQLANFCGRPQA
ncbi:hypothetical protein X797_011462 [Metarhizium robertsii]|uniref:Uncharacterized protein n=1 Tax=Metarhizium robertsii TaxID=568076 RepID=A0A014P2D5_9HYPO|nr:hypothetical protein X797_011462 [Metarhizium robertsii]